MNKYELRAEAVLKKREEYFEERRQKVNRTVKITAAAACVAVIAGVGMALNNQMKRTLPPEISLRPSENGTVTATIERAYNGKKVFISKEVKNQGDYVTCYVNDTNEENPYNANNSYGVMSAKGEIVVPPVYNKAFAVSENCFVVEKRNENHDTVSALTDSEGNVLFDYFRGYIRAIPYGEDVFVLIAEGVEGKDILLKTDGTPAIGIEFENLTYAHTASIPHGFENDEFIFGIYNNEIYLISYKGEIKGVYGEKPKIKKSLGNGFNLTAAFKDKTLLLGACDDAGKEIVPCEYNSLNFTGDRFVGRRGANQGLDPHDVAVIYDTQGNLVCESGVFLDIIFEYGAETGVGIAMGEWSDEKMVVLGGCWVIDKNGNKLSGEYDRIGKNSDGTYTAYYDGQTKTHLLDSNGNIIS